MANYLRDAIRYQQEMEEANRPVTVNSLMARKAAAIKQNAPAENMLTQYAQTMPQNWQQFGQNMAQAYPTPATGASRDQILGAVTQAAMNVGPLMTVYHGSPHRFDKFDSSKIGTGEGAQAYGHGLYLAENPGVALGYQKRLSNIMTDGGYDSIPRTVTYGSVNPRRVDLKATSASLTPAEMALTHAGITGSPFSAAQEIRQMIAANPPDIEKYRKALALLESGKLKASKIGTESGQLYKVDLPDEQIAKMLDWDKPLSQQAPYVQKALKENDLWNVVPEGKPLGEMVQAMERAMGKERTSAILKDLNVPGIRYLDQGSRAAPSSAQFAKTDVVGAADDLTALAKSMGLNAEVRHSGSNAGKSSYVSVFDPMTNRYIKSSFRISDHGTGPLRHQEHIHINSPADLATQKNDLFEWVKRNRTEKGVDTTGLSAPSQGTSNFVVFPGNEGLLKILERQ